MTITPEQEQAIRDKLAEMPQLSVGVGNEKSACSVAAINLALTGELTDTIPDCMSEVVGHWIIAIQDRIPASIRNSSAWRELLPLAAGTGREHEKERLKIITDWAWESLARLQLDVLILTDTEHQIDVVVAAVITAVIVGGWNQVDPIGLLRKLVEL